MAGFIPPLLFRRDRLLENLVAGEAGIFQFPHDRLGHVIRNVTRLDGSKYTKLSLFRHHFAKLGFRYADAFGVSQFLAMPCLSNCNWR